uniref:Spore protein YkvP/CgeB glycosyl transferase-like domain-containing protein n=1 Tax=Solibacter usitatus (strain Ellin6076) TaxID=234267 RepID=Q022V1_SOLUE
MSERLDIVILGLSVTSSWGNGHATTYRSLIRALADRGHRVLFLERDAPWYKGNRDQPRPAGARTELYESFDELVARFEGEVASAGLVIVGSFVPEGRRVGEWVTSVARGVTAFYDIDTPITLALLAEGIHEFISPELIRRYELYLSFTGGPTLRMIENRYGSPMARAFYCAVDLELYRPEKCSERWDLGYLGTYSDDRQPSLNELMLEAARIWPQGRFAVVGPMYPLEIRWPANVDREIHLSPSDHAEFYGSQRFTLNITREAMKRVGYAPSVRLFEAGACGVPIISDWWEGLDTLFQLGDEVLISSNATDTLRFLREYPDAKRRQVGLAARRRILTEHTPQQRVAQLEGYLEEVHDNLSAHPARRNGCERQMARGLDSGTPSQCPGQTASARTGGEAGDAAISGRLH